MLYILNFMKSSGFHIKSCGFHHWNHLNQIFQEKTLHLHTVQGDGMLFKIP